MPTINLLDNATISKIAAGEVIERPASIIKELIENSLDAKATRIEIEIENGGKTLIRIRDNGIGMSPEDLQLAPVRHATSKIQQFEDIYSVLSMGFRGEALSSISHVAILTLRSRQKDADLGYEVRAVGSDISTPAPVSMPVGTTVEVRNLFHSVPVRRKFLKSHQTELQQCIDWTQKFALLHPDKTFVLWADQKELLHTGHTQDAETLLTALYGDSLESKFIPVRLEGPTLKATGLLSDPTLTWSNKTRQIIAVNGRLMSNPLIQKLIYDLYHDRIPHRRHPILLLNIEIPVQELDVNIHPQKTDIKFLTPSILFSELGARLQALFTKIHPLQMTPIATPSNPYSAWNTESGRPSQPHTPHVMLNSFQHLLTREYAMPEILNQVQDDKQVQDDIKRGASTPQSLFSSAPMQPIQFFQFLQTYLIIPTPDAVWILDQHAVHERILYERIKTQTLSQKETQPLLLSEIIPLDPLTMATAQEQLPFLTDWGFGIEEFGPTQLLIREIPAILTDINLTQFIATFLEDLKEGKSPTQTILEAKKDTLQMKACKAAIKAGKKMTQREVEQLVTDFLATPSNYTCPHGRPLYIKLDKPKLEKLFLRT